MRYTAERVALPGIHVGPIRTPTTAETNEPADPPSRKELKRPGAPRIDRRRRSARGLAAGRAVYAVGSDTEAARLAGMRPRRVVLVAFVAANGMNASAIGRDRDRTIGLYVISLAGA